MWRVAVFLAAFAPDPAIMRGVIADLIEDFPSPAQRADLLWFASVLDLSVGRVNSARDALADAVEAERSVAAERRRWGFEDVTEWFAATLPLPYAESTLVRVREVTGPAIVNHYNMFTSAEVSGSPRPGFSSGQAIATMGALATQELPSSMGTEWTELTLLHVQFHDRLAPDTVAAVLQGYRGRYAILRDAVTETEPAFREDLLGEIPVIDLLEQPIHLLADRWRQT